MERKHKIIRIAIERICAAQRIFLKAYYVPYI